MSAIELKIPKAIAQIAAMPKRFKLIYGGRGSGKTMSVALIMAAQCMSGKKICCFRQFWTSIRDSQYTEIVDAIDHHGLTGFEILKTEIRHASGGYVTFKGLERNLSSTKGLKGFNFFWLEEGQDISDEAIKVLTPTLREEGSELWITANPQRAEDPLSQKFISRTLTEKTGLVEHDDLYARVKVNYDSNPWFPSSLDSERRDDYQNLDRALYNHVWLGDYNDTIEHGIFLAEWIDAAIDSHKKLNWQPFGAKVVTHDPADTSDARATLYKQGNIIYNLHNELSLDINQACYAATTLAIEQGAHHFIYDADGCGLGLRDQVRKSFDNTGIQWHEFKGGGKVEDEELALQTDHIGRAFKNREFYRNLRAQKYHQLAMAFERTYKAVEKGIYSDPQELISIDSSCKHIDELRSELTSITRVFNSNGTYQLLSKDKMKSKLKLRSPNLADCLMMSMIQLNERKKITRVDPGFKFA